MFNADFKYARLNIWGFVVYKKDVQMFRKH